jgi:hypothetical protein
MIKLKSTYKIISSLKLVDLIVYHEFIWISHGKPDASHYDVRARYSIRHINCVILEHQTHNYHHETEGANCYVNCIYELDHIDYCYMEHHS